MADLNPNHVAIEIEAMLAGAQPLLTTECCIYRVPYEIRKLNEDAYTPKIVSIGPFHHGNTRLLDMENHKKTYCNKFIRRARTSLHNLVSCVQKLEPRVRRCYSQNIKLSEEELVKVILVDCGFIFEIFWMWKNRDDDGIRLNPWLMVNIKLDLLLLENQLPFFALEELYSLAFATQLNDGPNYPSFLQLTFNYFAEFNKLELSAARIEHFTDLLRTFHLQLPSRPLFREDLRLLTRPNSVSELNEAGVKFKVNRASKCLLDLKFSGCYLEIPEFLVEDSTELLFRNMLALEQCHYLDESYITDYVAVLDFLINTGKDVDVLVQNGIILNYLGDNNAVAELFNGIGKNTLQVSFNADYLRICTELNDHCKHPWHTTKATLRRDYCKTPWQTLASIAAIILLILTVIQTLCSIIQVV